MPAMFALSKTNKFQGVFTQRKILWGIIEQLEGREPNGNTEPIDSLVIRDDEKGKIKSPESGYCYTEMTYVHLCAFMRDHNRVSINDAKTFETRYAIWQSEKNELFERGESDNETDEN